MKDYADSSLIGNPIPYSGNPNDYHEIKVEDILQSSVTNEESNNDPNDPNKEDNKNENNHNNNQDNEEGNKDEDNQNNNQDNEEGNKDEDNQNNNDPSILPNQNNNNEENNNQDNKDPSILPIISISPYLMQWKIRGVITDKSILRDITTSKGPSKVFNFCITDKKGTAIRMTAFGDLATQFFDIIHDSESYTIKGNNKAIQSANKRFNTTGHKYEVILRNDMEIERCEAPSEMPVQKINRVSLNQIKLHVGELIDVITVVENIEEPVDVNTKRGMTKRKVIYLFIFWMNQKH
uniref:OB domain-containing protein n=1 Tax=Strongyloides stercoralis TaxID=6248 RepID=A0AAF5CZK7_STRER